ncbi:hypothetical protein EMIT047CA2_80108 [Pseudomonas soli]
MFHNVRKALYDKCREYRCYQASETFLKLHTDINSDLS